jgi:hypothetical protein
VGYRGSTGATHSAYNKYLGITLHGNIFLHMSSI